MALSTESLGHIMGLDWMRNPFEKSDDFDLSLDHSFSGLESFFDLDTINSGKNDSVGFQRSVLRPVATDMRTNNQTPSSRVQESLNSFFPNSTVQSSSSSDFLSPDPGQDSTESLNLLTPGPADVLGSFFPSLITQGQSSTDTPEDPMQMPYLKLKPELATDKGYWIKRLTDLNVKLFEHSDTIPAVEVHNRQDSATPVNGTTTSPAKNPKEVHIETSFHYSQELIEILNHLYPQFLSRPPSLEASHARREDPSKPSNNFEKDSSLPSHSPSSAPNLFPVLDQGSKLLALYSYLRLIEACHRIFGHIQNCVLNTHKTCKDDQIRLPKLSIGSYVVPASSVMQIMLVINLTKTLLSRIRSLVGAMVFLGPSDEGNEATADAPLRAASISDINSVTLRAILVSEADLIQLMGNIKKLLVKSNVL